MYRKRGSLPSQQPMSLRRNIGTLLQCLGINLLSLSMAAVLDIVLSVLMLRFSSAASTFVCFSVAGIFSAVYCYRPVSAYTGRQQRERAARLLLIALIILCALMFSLIAPLSGREYSGPVQFFAAAQIAMAVFLWKTKSYQDVDASGHKKNN